LFFILANSKLKEIEKIEKIQEEFFCILYDYMSGKVLLVFMLKKPIH
jgi:hypothetical protein